MNTAEPHQLLGAYLLGGLDAKDLETFEAHLQECGKCRDELAGLEKIPVLLDALPVPDAVALTAVPGRLPDPVPSPDPAPLLRKLAHRRRTLRRRWTALAAAAAAACLALGLAGGPLLARPPQPDATYSVQSGGGLQFRVDLARKTWGTELAVNGSSLPAEGTLSLWVRDRDGGEDRACAWTATPSGRVKVTGATPLQLGSISSVELRDATERAVAVITVP
ncbi:MULTISPECIES: zf-HC2 domain-containing protein [Micrococcaceae]|uniref:zf-HC2 domain-containing protein n=1 Tax=Micrococcaceae TaxID=1268 RepID=UPI00137D96F3|nr:zf-HC2 domain-containing protein [Pseudarthrobacter sp. C1]MEA3551394.1 zf-HC2 domain-containing protein [Pseudarthrobacter sp. C1]MUU71882.1 anti-sigma factor [Pseudarthrobacter sp. GA104]